METAEDQRLRRWEVEKRVRGDGYGGSKASPSPHQLFEAPSDSPPLLF
jgi:hypothetical protein